MSGSASPTVDRCSRIAVASPRPGMRRGARRWRPRLVELFLCLGSLCAATGSSPGEGLTPDQKLQFFETKVRPLLIARCYECHSSASDTVGGNLLLDRSIGWRQGGDSGPAIRPGEPDASLLVTAIRYRTDELQMPPDERLSDQDIAVIVAWIQMGAPDPRDEQPLDARSPNSEEARKFWAFQPPEAINPPKVRDEQWPNNGLDRFVLAAHEQRGLRHAAPASKRVLIRRATFDLTGLPPTPAEVDGFLRDDLPDAYARLLDRLLASPRYGERWGRFWLDVARYADSNGLDENIAYGNAWRYRDYVIRSLNDDMPFAQFVLEQLAGDLLPPAADPRVTRRRAIATGFLSLGPKVLAEVDETKMEMDIIDEQVETVGRALMGLTLGCARCHDHKFDPISTADYYAVAGIFKSTKTMEHFTKIARWHEISIASSEERRRREAAAQRVADKKQEIAEYLQRATEQLGCVSSPTRGQAATGGEHVDRQVRDNEKLFDGETRRELGELREQLRELEAAVPELPTAMGVVDNETSTDLRVHIRGNYLTQGRVVRRGVPAVLAPAVVDSIVIGEKESGRLQLAEWLIASDHPLSARVIVNRVWRWHFGRGLVPSTDNFGRLGDRPSHPQLLNWLARRFVSDGWSLKSLHRLIMQSSTYQMSCENSPSDATTDPTDRYLWRWPARRLEAEAIRDAMLAAAGLLQESMGGSLLHVGNREFVFDHTSKDQTNYASFRRSVYLPVIRNHLYDAFQLFDFADASVLNGDRPTTTVAPQALFLMNSQLVDDAAAAFADRVLASDRCGSVEQRLGLAYQIAFGRSPTQEELARDVRFLGQFSRQAAASVRGGDVVAVERVAWQLLCQAVLMSNEFIYLR